MAYLAFLTLSHALIHISPVPREASILRFSEWIRYRLQLNQSVDKTENKKHVNGNEEDEYN